MIKTVDQTTVADIFSINNNSIYRIPKYQREYTWGKNEWDALFNDVTENDSGYFLGSYICVNSGSLNGTVLEIIDGQQRFTTIILLMAALYEKLTSYADEMDEDEKNDLANLRSELANKKKIVTPNGKRTEYSPRLILQKQNMNDEDFNYILSEKGIVSSTHNYPLNFGNRRIARAYRHFCKMIDEEILEVQKEKPTEGPVDILFSIVSKFDAAILVGIEVDTNKDAYMLFESLNHRGVPLSALDLIKNTLIAQAENDAKTEECYEQWKQILNNVGQDDYAVQERFFRQYYNAFRDELNEPYKDSDKKYYLGYLATRTTLLDIYEKMIKSDYQALIDDLLCKSKNYSVIVNNSDEGFTYSSSLQDLARISGAPGYILILYLMSNQTELELTEDNLNAVIKYLITFFVRRNVTDVPNTRKLTQLFIDIINEAKVLRADDLVNTVLHHSQVYGHDF